MTNLYAAWRMAQPGVRFDDKWMEVTEPEMRSFLAINILMGISPLPQIEMYWSKDPYLQNAGITQTMTCNRFQKILQYFHVSDRAAEPARGQPDYDPLFKIRPIMDRLAETFKTCYTLSREVSIDEGMIAFSGRLSCKQYMPAKPIKRGVKVWMMADANSSYLARFEFYLGRQETGTEHGLGYNVVMKLSDYLRHTHRRLFFDNFFTGVELMERLLEYGLYACGTVRPMRKGFPQQLKKPADVRNRGQFRVLQKGTTNLTASVWMDRKQVYHLSTLSDPQERLLAQRRTGANVAVLPQPHSVHSYNKFMGGVDVHDQYRACYDVGRKGKKAWRYMFWYLFNVAIINAFIMYKEASSRVTKKRRFRHIDFRLELLKQLVGGFTKRKRSVSDAGLFEGMVEAENIGGHVNSRMDGKGRRCRYHLKHLNQRKETVYGCSVCRVHLCKECHTRWHNL